MPDRFMAILAPNWASQPYAAAADHYTAGTIAASMPLANILTEEPAKRSRLLTHDPLDTYWQVELAPLSFGGIPKTFGALGLINCNLSRFGMARFFAKDSGGARNYTRVLPDAQLAATNLTGSVTDVDETPRSPDSLWATPTDKSLGWDVRYSFPTPFFEPAPGANLCAFVLWVRRQGSDVSIHPLIKVEVWESGVQKAVLDTKVVSEAGGQILIFRWSASVLTTASGANAEIKVFGAAQSALCYCELGAVAWDSEPAGVYDFDSGWFASPFDSVSAGWGASAGSEAGPEPTKNLSYLPATPWTNVINWWVAFSDDQADNTRSFADDFVAAALVSSPAGYAQAGHAPGGPAFTPSEVNFGRGPLLSARDPSISGHTLGGQEYGSRRRQRRVLPVTLPQLTEQEGYDLFDRIDWRKGKKMPVLVVKYPDGGSANRRHTTLWCTLEEMPGLAISRALGKHSWSGVFIEKL